jgi:hypothetical protein
MEEALLMLGLLLSAAYLIRISLILCGLLKSHILSRLEFSGASCDANYPLRLLGWLGLFVLCLGILLQRISGTTFPAYLPGLVILLLRFAAQRAFGLASRSPGLFSALPRWYAELCDRTTRDERRRIAYMWLKLPRRTRLYYEWHTEAFMHWIDLVIVSIRTQSFEEIMRTMVSAHR